MKKAVAISVAVLFLFQSAGMFLLFKWHQAEIRQEIKERIKAGVPESELVELEFHRSQLEGQDEQFRWIHKKEFIYQNQLYDIVHRKTAGDSTTFLCIPDFKETKLLKNLNHLISNELGKEKIPGSTKIPAFLHWIDQFEKPGIISFRENNNKLPDVYLFACKCSQPERYWHPPRLHVS